MKIDNKDNDDIKETVVKVKKKRGRKPKPKPLEPVVKIKKKRGRKPKPKPLEPVVKIKKKRGRKPKPKTDEDLKPKVLKKRGRKPKNQIYKLKNLSNLSNLNIDKNQNIIIHLPIKAISNSASYKEKELLTYNPDLSNPEPNDINNDNYKYINDTKDNTSEYNKFYSLKEQNILDDLNSNEDNESKNDTPINDFKINNDYNIEHLGKWYKPSNNDNSDINKIMENIKEQRDINKSNYSISNTDNKVEKCLKQLEEYNINNEWPLVTSVYCWWCCHPFKNRPCCLPCKLSKNVFKVVGIFCSPECSAAYNFSDINSGYDNWERYSLLNFLYKKAYNANVKIKLAAPKNTLKIFGGALTIKQFRENNINYNNTYRLIMPPLISILPIQERVNLNNTSIKVKKNNNLKIQRSKPTHNNTNTLEKCMNLKSIHS